MIGSVQCRELDDASLPIGGQAPMTFSLFQLRRAWEAYRE